MAQNNDNTKCSGWGVKTVLFLIVGCLIALFLVGWWCGWWLTEDNFETTYVPVVVEQVEPENVNGQVEALPVVDAQPQAVPDAE